MRIVIGVNTLTSLDRTAYINHCQFWYRLGRDWPKDEFVFNVPHRMPIDRMRNMTAKIALDTNADYLMFVDDDVLIPLDCLSKLLTADQDIVAGWTVIRGYPFNNMFFKYVDEEKKNLTYYNKFELNGSPILPVDAVGFSCVLIKTSLLKAIPPPYFVTGPYNTEDVYFCIKARQYAPECTIAVETSVLTGHIMDTEVVEPLTRESFKRFYEDAYAAKEGTDKPEKLPETDNDKYVLSYEEVLKEAVFNAPK